MEDSPFNINKDYSSFRHNHLTAINELLSIESYNSKKHELETALKISHFLFYISNESDLAIIIEGLKAEKLLIDYEPIELKIMVTLNSKEYTSLQKARIKAIICSQYIAHSILSYEYHILFPEGVGKFDFVIHEGNVVTTVKAFKSELNDRIINHTSETLNTYDNKKVSSNIPSGRVLVGVYFLTGEADTKYEELKSWRKVADYFMLPNFSGQFSATSKKESNYNQNDVFHTHQKGIIDYCHKKGIDIKRIEYIKPE